MVHGQQRHLSPEISGQNFRSAGGHQSIDDSRPDPVLPLDVSGAAFRQVHDLREDDIRCEAFLGLQVISDRVEQCRVCMTEAAEQPRAAVLRAEHLSDRRQPQLYSRQAHLQVRSGRPQLHFAERRATARPW